MTHSFFYTFNLFGGPNQSQCCVEESALDRVARLDRRLAFLSVKDNCTWANSKLPIDGL